MCALNPGECRWNGVAAGGESNTNARREIVDRRYLVRAETAPRALEHRNGCAVGLHRALEQCGVPQVRLRLPLLRNRVVLTVGVAGGVRSRRSGLGMFAVVLRFLRVSRSFGSMAARTEVFGAGV